MPHGVPLPADAAHVHGDRARGSLSDHRHPAPDAGYPANCQWAIFLRNHDELTLEMVTDAERDYLWETYAADRRARLNLGIRRRLAPLLERDRRRIELMNALLLSMPGTPVIYYGDEIGMGDNIHLGDRDGVRTPMQWSPDRNGGFSRADPARLVLPPIMDPLYGYEAVNVEAQAGDPHSLLNWMRRMLAVRQRHRRSAAGDSVLLYPENRKILAFLREYEAEGADETILCVANLSRTPQAVELDLAQFAGRMPVDLHGGSVFPPIGQLPYLLTLPPYGFYWFSWRRIRRCPPGACRRSEPMPEYVTLVMRNEIGELLAPEPKRVIEQEILPAYLAERRWFAAKDRKSARSRDRARRRQLPRARPRLRPAGRDRGHARMAGSDRYFLPAGIVWEDDEAAGLAATAGVGARARGAARMGFLTDAFAVDALPAAVLASLAAGRAEPLPDGEMRWSRPASRFQRAPPDAEMHWLSAEQSNSSLILGESRC